MKKRSLLAVALGVASLTAMAQSPVRLQNSGEGVAPTPYSELNVLGKKQTVSEWYNFIDDAEQGGISFTVYGNNSLWPDSLALQRYGSTGGGVELGSTGRHNVGQMFDPKSFYYTNPFTEHNPYTVDSIRLGYRYAHNMPGTVDTVEVQVFNGAGVLSGNLVDANGNVLEKTAWIGYNRTLGIGSNASQTFRFTLDENDNNWTTWTIKGLELPQPVSISRNGLIAVAYRYIPGFAYSLNDTLDHQWDTLLSLPVRKLNHFQPLIGTDNAKTAEDSYNHGLSIRKFQKYNQSTNWDQEFIPGDAWNDFTEYVYVSFKATSPNVGLAKNNVKVANAYPNPASSDLNVDYSVAASGEVSVELYDLLGNKVKTISNGVVEAGSYTATTSVSDLKSGVYFVTIKSGNNVATQKVTVVK